MGLADGSRLGLAYLKPEAEPEAVGFCAKRTDTDLPKNKANTDETRASNVQKSVNLCITSANV